MPPEIPPSPEPLPSRPKLDKEPIAFNTVRDAGIGAVMGAVLGATLDVAERIIFKTPINGKNTALYAALVSGGAAIGAYVSGKTINEERKKAKPYVERLEQELLTKSVTQATPPQR